MEIETNNSSRKKIGKKQLFIFGIAILLVLVIAAVLLFANKKSVFVDYINEEVVCGNSKCLGNLKIGEIYSTPNDNKYKYATLSCKDCHQFYALKFELNSGRYNATGWEDLSNYETYLNDTCPICDYSGGLYPDRETMFVLDSYNENIHLRQNINCSKCHTPLYFIYSPVSFKNVINEYKSLLK